MAYRLSPALTSRVGQGRHTPRNDEQMAHGPYHSSLGPLGDCPLEPLGTGHLSPQLFIWII